MKTVQTQRLIERNNEILKVILIRIY